MPLGGIGPAPSGSLFNELTAVVRRAFIPKLFVQLYFASPTLYHLWGTANTASGGLNQITIPMQGQSAVQGQFTNYGGGFNAPQITPSVQDGQWNLAYWVVPVPLPFGETILQSSSERVIPLLKVRMNDVYAVTWQKIATQLFQGSAGNPNVPQGFLDAFDNGTNTPTYGGINRTAAGNSAFQGQYINAGGGTIWNTNFTTSTGGWNRKAMAALLIYITNQAGGEMPTFVVMNPSDFATLNNDVVGTEQQFVKPDGGYTVNSTARAVFPNLNVAGVPIFADNFCPKGNLFAVNTQYSTFFIDENAALEFSGFYSLVPLNQIGQQGVTVLGYNFISAKSSSGAWVYGFGGGAF
jgi:hypothetical protein